MAQDAEKRGLIASTEQGCDDADESYDTVLSSCEKGVLKRPRGKKSIKPSTNAARERSRVQNLKQAFLELQKALPNVPSGTKLSKLDILLLATNYISHLMSKLSNGHLKEHLTRLKDSGTLHPIKKWPMRSRLYVSDPMWLYRSGRQSIMLSQNVESPSSSSPSVSCEESPPSLDVADLQSPSDSSIDETDRFALPYRYSCREEVPYSRAPTEVSMEYNYPRGNGAYLTSAQEQSYRRSSCRFQGALPDGSTEYQNSR